jgi:hypothetical protein
VSDLSTQIIGKHVLLESVNTGSIALRAAAEGHIELGVLPASASSGSQAISIIAGSRSDAATAAGQLFLQAGLGSALAGNLGGELRASGGHSAYGQGGSVLLSAGTGALTGGDASGGSVSILGGEAFARTFSTSAGHVGIFGGKANNNVESGSISLVIQPGGSGKAAGSVNILLGAGTPDGEFEVFGADSNSKLKITTSVTAVTNQAVNIVATETSTGTVSIQSGPESQLALTTSGVVGGTSGSLLLSSGNAAAAASSNSGSISILSGDGALHASSESGRLVIKSGSASQLSGAVHLLTGTADTNTGSIILSTGDVGTSSGANIQLLGAFPGDAKHGHVAIKSGSSPSAGGHIFLISGTGTAPGEVSVVIGSEASSRINLADASSRLGAANVGGSVTITSKDASGSNLNLFAGSPGGSLGSSVLVEAGGAVGAVDGGSVSVVAGSASGAGNGGSVVLQPGSSSSGTPGDVIIKNAAGTTVQTFGTSSWSVSSEGPVTISSADSQVIELLAGGSSASVPVNGASISLLAEAGSSLGGNIEITAGGGTSAGGDVILQAGSMGAVLLKDSVGATALSITNAGLVQLSDTTVSTGKTLKIEGKTHILGEELILPSETTNSFSSFLDILVPARAGTIDVRTKTVVRVHRNGSAGADEILNVNCNDGQVVIVINDDEDDVIVVRPAGCTSASSSAIDRHRVVGSSVGLLFCSCTP